MRQIQASEAKTRFLALLDQVEAGETVVITRHGRPIARLVPEVEQQQAALERTLAEIEQFRRTMPRMSLDELLSGRHEGHKY